MCGILALLDKDSIDIERWVKNLKARGPESTRITNATAGLIFGFTRLAINGLTENGMQPFQRPGLTWMCNGEIYNSKEIEKKLDISGNGSDCYCIGDLYMRHRDDLTTFARALDGVFALTLYDDERKLLVVARDPYGVRPLFVGNRSGTINPSPLCFSSEIKAIPPRFNSVKAFPPGCIRAYNLENFAIVERYRYHSVPWIQNPIFSSLNHPDGPEAARRSIRYSLELAVEKRMLTERPVAALLSGGLDSSLIASIVQGNLKHLGLPPLKTFSIGFKGSSDLAHARIVANWIKSDHTEIVMTPDEFFKAIPEVIRAIESYDTTTVRASVGNYLVAKKIKELSNCKVVFNGDGSDELFGGYLYFNKAPSDDAFMAETGRLLEDIHTFDVLRSDRSISANGLEARTPFLDKQFVAVVRSIHPELLRPVPGKQCEKFILRQAFDDGITLPPEVLWRRKEAFSDGVSSQEKPWFKEIQERVLELAGESWYQNGDFSLSHHLMPRTPEEYYYRFLFLANFGISAIDATVPYRWMPKWCPETTDPSARTLGIY